MLFAIALLAVSAVVASPTSKDYLRVVWEYDTAKHDPVAISVYDKDMTVQYVKHAINGSLEPSGYYAIDTHSFAKNPIILTIDHDLGYSGEITWNGVTSDIYDDNPGGVNCLRAWHTTQAAIDCLLPFSGDFLETFPINTREDDFQAFNYLLRYKNTQAHSLEARNDRNVSEAAPADGTTEPGKPLNKHTDVYFQQTTVNHHCGNAPTCTVSETQAKSVSFTFTAAVTPIKWITAGLSVAPKENAHTTSTACGAKKGQVVCIALQLAYYTYNVKNCSGGKCGKNFKLSSPIKPGRSHTMCHIGSICKYDGYKNF